jgi:hypothetical protein
MTDDIQLIEVSAAPGGEPEEILSAPRTRIPWLSRPAGGRRWPILPWRLTCRPGMRAVLAGAVVVTVAAAVLVSHRAGPASVPVAAPSASVPTWTLPPPDPLARHAQPEPSTAYQPLDPTVLTALRAQVCAGRAECTYLPDPPQWLAVYLWMFPTAAQIGGGSLIGSDGTMLGRGATVTLASGVQYSLTLLRAHGPSLPGETTSRRMDGGTVTLTARRGSWDLISTVTFEGSVWVPLGPARTWLASSALPDGWVAGTGAPA